MLNPFTAQSLTFPGCKMHGRACKQYIFRSYNPSTFGTMCLMKILSHASPKRETKRLNGSKFRTFTGRVHVAWRQWKGQVSWAPYAAFVRVSLPAILLQKGNEPLLCKTVRKSNTKVLFETVCLFPLQLSQPHEASRDRVHHYFKHRLRNSRRA